MIRNNDKLGFQNIISKVDELSQDYDAVFAKVSQVGNELLNQVFVSKIGQNLPSPRLV